MVCKAYEMNVFKVRKENKSYGGKSIEIAHSST